MMMADLRDFAATTADLPPEKATLLVNNYLDKMVEILLDHGGSIDGFTAGGVLGLFGAPTTRPDDAQRALACALAMQLAMPVINALNEEMGLPAMTMGVGLHSGEVVLGNIGSEQRAEYGALGSAVRLAGRIEAQTVGGEVMISQATHDALQGFAALDGHRYLESKGQNQPVAIYSVIGITGRPDLALSRG